MEFKGTKGEWKRVKLEGTKFAPETNEIQFEKSGRFVVAEAVSNDYDAQLISCAPEMLEMLIRMRDNEDWDITDLLDLKQLIKKATEI